jgi:serine/threonine-protein kinase
MTDEARLRELLSLYDQRRRHGEDPAATELCAESPHLAPALAEWIAALRGMEALAGQLNETADAPAGPAAETHSVSPPSGQPFPALPGYEILGELGHGGMGVVYKARDLALKRLVAIKMALPGHGGADRLGRFRAEAEAVARLEHPHIVRVLTSGEHQGQPYFVLEYVAGGSLDTRLRGRPQPPGNAARLVLLLARAVAAAHHAGVIHRDLKPANVLLAPPADEPALNTAYGLPKIADFGLARFLGEPAGVTLSGEVLGTPSYMAPEQAAGKVAEVGPAADVWALGVILYELLTGCLPFRGESVLQTLEQVRTRPVEPPSRVRADTPCDLETICLRCLAKDPRERYLTAAALAEELARFLDGRVLAPAPLTVRPQRRWLALAVAAVALALGAGVWWMTHPSPDGKDSADPTPAGARTVPLPKPRYRGEIQVRVERTVEEGMPPQLLTLGEHPRALPLRRKDRFRIEAKVEPAAFLYLIWVDPGKDVTPVYPWDPVKGWGSRPANEGPVPRLSLPPAARDLYEADEAKPGVATMVLLARPTKLDVPDAEVRRWFEALPDLPLPPGGERGVVWFDNYVAVTGDPTRHGTFRVVPASDPFAAWQGRLQRAVGDRAAFQTAISFARTGRK